MRSPYVLLAALAIVFAACDSATPVQSPTTDVVTLDTRAAATGDVLYRLAPLALDESFEVALDLGDDALQLRSTRSDAGYDLTFDPAGASVDRVVVRYLRDGEPVAEPVVFSGAEPVFAGAAADGPDSWHYIYEDGRWVIAKDYKNDAQGTSGDEIATSSFRTAAGEVVDVTDVAFEIYGLDAPAPRSVRFETPRSVEITAQAFGRAIR